LGKKAMVDYVAQCRFGKLGSDLRVTFELYKVSTSGLIDKFSESAKNVDGLLAIMEKKIPDGFMKIPGAASRGKVVLPHVAGGISGLKTADDYEISGSRYFLASINTEPQGATLSFDGIPNEKCSKTPCKVEIAEGKVRIIAALEQYERADTTVSIKQNNQNISIRLKPNFGILEIKPAYSEGIGKNENWSLTINGKVSSSLESRLSPGKYSVNLSHRCYEDISFDVGINKDKREVFDMTSHAKPKKGGLALSAEKDGSPVSEPVFVNGIRVGETPFSGSVAVCSEIEIGSGKEKENVDVKVEHKQTVKHVHKAQSGGVIDGVLTDKRDGKKYKVVKIRKQTWMAENLNYDAKGSKCYHDKLENCQKYGRLYDWSTAKKACPSGWHLPSDKEWDVLIETAGDDRYKLKLRAKSWLGTDEFGFSALPGGCRGGPTGGGLGLGEFGFWWGTRKSLIFLNPYSLGISANKSSSWCRSEGFGGDKFSISIRCLQD